MQVIYAVDEVHLFHLPGLPFLAVTATGRVPTTGWSHPQLGARITIAPPADGIQDYDFYADEPRGFSLPVLTPIAASQVIARDWRHYWGPGKPLRGVRVHARTNALEATPDMAKEINLAAAAPGLAGSDLPFPSPFPISAWELIGKTLRVYTTGDPLTEDYRTDRANVELSRNSHRIVRVWIG